MESNFDRQFNNLYSELEILNNNILNICNSLELLKKKNVCSNLLDYKELQNNVKEKKKAYNEKTEKIKNTKEIDIIDSDLELELILSRNLNKKPKKKTKKKKRIVRSIMVLDTSSESEFENNLVYLND